MNLIHDNKLLVTFMDIYTYADTHLQISMSAQCTIFVTNSNSNKANCLCGLWCAYREIQRKPHQPFPSIRLSIHSPHHQSSQLAEFVPAAMQGVMWSLYALLCLCLWGQCSCRGRRTKRATEDDAKKCSYTFMVPEQKITGQTTRHSFFTFLLIVCCLKRLGHFKGTFHRFSH